jgi:hypothetical protein
LLIIYPLTTFVTILGILFSLSVLLIPFSVNYLQVLAQTSVQNQILGNASGSNATSPITSPSLTSGNASGSNATSPITSPSLTSGNASGSNATSPITSTPVLTTDNVTSIIVAILTGAGTLGVTSLTAHYSKNAAVQKVETEKQAQRAEFAEQKALEEQKHKNELASQRDRIREELRATYEKDLRNTRINNYTELWKSLAKEKNFNLFVPPVSPQAEKGLTYQDVEDIDRKLEEWFYTYGGFFMTPATNENYDKLRSFLLEIINQPSVKTDHLPKEKQIELRNLVRVLGYSLIGEVKTSKDLMDPAKE